MTHILANRRGMLRATAGLAAASLLGNLSPALSVTPAHKAAPAVSGASSRNIQRLKW